MHGLVGRVVEVRRRVLQLEWNYERLLPLALVAREKVWLVGCLMTLPGSGVIRKPDVDD